LPAAAARLPPGAGAARLRARSALRGEFPARHAVVARRFPGVHQAPDQRGLHLPLRRPDRGADLCAAEEAEGGRGIRAGHRRQGSARARRVTGRRPNNKDTDVTRIVGESVRFAQWKRALIVAALTLIAAASAQAQQWPARQIRVISPYPAGSASDTVTRVVLDQVSQLIVEVKPGAGGSLGFATVAHAAPDGYTLVTSSSSMATESVLHSKLPYDPARDFVPVVLIGTSPNLLVASKQSGFKT